MGADLAEDVREVLTAAGIPAAEMDESRRALTQGFNAYLLPMPEDRVAIDWHGGYGSYSEADAFEPCPGLAGCAAALDAAGYQSEFVAGVLSGYLVAWAGGEF